MDERSTWCLYVYNLGKSQWRRLLNKNGKKGYGDKKILMWITLYEISAEILEKR